MLHYLYDVTLNLFISVTVITVFFALARLLLGRTGTRIMLGGTLAGFAIAAYRAVRHAFMSTYDVEINLYTFYVGIIAMALMLVALPIFCHKRAPAWGKTVTVSLSALISADLLFYKAWKVIWAPAEFDTAGQGVISWDFLERLGGWALALILLIVYTHFLYKCLLRLSEDEALWVNKEGEPFRKLNYLLVGGAAELSLGLLATNFAGQILRTWRTKNTVRVITEAGRKSWVTYYKYRPSWFPAPESGSAYNKWEMNFSIDVGNNALLFIILAGVIALIPLIVLLVRSMLKRGRYANNAQLRRLKSNRRHNRRKVAIVIACFIIAILNLTVVYALDNRVEAEPEPETYIISEDGTKVLIPVEQVNDFNLHAFSI
ncbi:MAG: hypothetical protein II920_02265, partial [Clostridia bacterium]|nr:hypothetical protein [Clostridia bacterium]